VAKRCLIVSFYFPPTGGGGVQRIVKLIKYLSRTDWHFKVITSGDPGNLPSDAKLLDEIPQKVQIVNISLSGKKSSNKIPASAVKSTFLLRWISSFMFIPDRYKKWVDDVKNKILENHQNETFDLILITTPPYSLALLAAELTEKIHIPVVLDMRDPWTTNPYKIYPTAWHLKKDRQMEMKAIKRIKYGISAYSSMIDFYKNRIDNFNAENWRHISNGFDEEDFLNIKPVALDNRMLNIAFSGTFYSHINNPKLLFKAIKSLNPGLKEKIKFHHIGSSHIDLKKLAASFDLSSNVVEWGYRAHNECIDILSGMDACCFILDSSNPKSNYTIGGKVYEYLRLGKPVLALVPPAGEAADLINLNKAGIVIDSNDICGIQNVLTSWLKEKPGVEISESRFEYERERLAEKYSEFFNQIIARD